MLSSALCITALWLAVPGQLNPTIAESPALEAAKAVLQKQVEADGVVLADLELQGVEINIIARTNVERTSRGLPALKISSSLINSARKHCQWMAANNNLQHTSAPVAENIAWNQNDSAEALQSWMNSAGHRANILSGRYTEMGAASYVAANGSVYWCQQFR